MLDGLFFPFLHHVAASLKQGRAPDVSPRNLRAVRAVIHSELAGIVFLILFAALMARGVGYFG